MRCFSASYGSLSFRLALVYSLYGIRTFRVYRSSGMVQVGISSFQRAVAATPTDHLLNESPPRRLLRGELAQKLY